MTWTWNEIQDELIWGAAWLYKASNNENYMKFVKSNIQSIQPYEFGWDAKHAGINVLVSQVCLIFYYISGFFRQNYELSHFFKHVRLVFLLYLSHVISKISFVLRILAVGDEHFIKPKSFHSQCRQPHMLFVAQITNQISHILQR